MNRSELFFTEKRVLKTIKKHFSTLQDAHFVLGVSGGVDSMSLLHIFSQLEIPTTVVHINYGTRGEASNKDEQLVKKICAQQELECKIFKADRANDSSSNFQAWARNYRYQRFNEIAQKIDATGIAVAHNRDDQIETILQKMFRGGGLASWSAMEIWNGSLLRPLLDITRAEIKKYAGKRSITYRTDQSNLQSNYARNFLRNEWLKQLEDHFPGWQKNILRIAEQGKIFQSALNYIVNDIRADDNELLIDPFQSLPLPLQKSLLLYFIKKIEPDATVSTHALSQITTLNTLQTGQKIELNDQISIMRNRSTFAVVFKNSQTLPAPIYLQQEQLAEPTSYRKATFKLGNFDNPNFKNKLYLDTAKLQWPVKVRRWKQGDRFQPLGLEGHQTVADHLTNRKVNATKKNQAIVIQSFEESIAAVIFPSFNNQTYPGTISEQFKCSDTTRQTLTIIPTS